MPPNDPVRIVDEEGNPISASNPLDTSGSSGGGGGGATTIADGADINSGSTTDAAVTTDAAGTLSAKLRGLVTLFVNLLSRIPTSLGKKTTVQSFAVTFASDEAVLPVSGTVGVSGTVTADTELPAASALADGQANPTAPAVGAFNMIRNTDNAWYYMVGCGSDASWQPLNVLAAGQMQYNPITNMMERLRTNYHISLLNSGARTATAASADQVNRNHRGLILFVNVTAQAGGSISPSLQIQEQIASGYATIWTAATPITATGLYMFEIYPGSMTAALWTEVVQAILARHWRLNMIHNNGSSITYSSSAQLIQ